MPDINPSARGARGRKRAAKPDEHTSPSSNEETEVAASGRGRKARRCAAGSSQSSSASGNGNWTFEHQGVDPKLLQELEAQLAVKPVDQEKIYQTVSNDIREELLGNLVRYLLMRSSRKRQITRTDINNDVMGKFRGMRGLLNHLLLRADEYLRKVFGYQIVVGSWVDDKTSGTFYLYNTIAEVGEGVEVAAMEHLAEVQNGSGQRAAVAERGLLMVTLALSLHGGNDGVAEQILIDRLRQIDSSIRPGNSDSLRMHGDINKAFKTLLNDWTTKQKYFVKERKDFHGGLADFYRIGPRALVEIGRPSILSFVHGAQGHSVDQRTLDAIRTEEAGEAAEVE